MGSIAGRFRGPDGRRRRCQDLELSSCSRRTTRHRHGCRHLRHGLSLVLFAAKPADCHLHHRPYTRARRAMTIYGRHGRPTAYAGCSRRHRTAGASAKSNCSRRRRQRRGLQPLDVDGAGNCVPMSNRPPRPRRRRTPRPSSAEDRPSQEGSPFGIRAVHRGRWSSCPWLGRGVEPLRWRHRKLLQDGTWREHAAPKAPAQVFDRRLDLASGDDVDPEAFLPRSDDALAENTSVAICYLQWDQYQSAWPMPEGGDTTEGSDKPTTC